MPIGVENGNSVANPELGPIHLAATPIRVECKYKYLTRGVLHVQDESDGVADVDDLAQEAPVTSRYVSDPHVSVETEVQEILVGEPSEGRE